MAQRFISIHTSERDVSSPVSRLHEQSLQQAAGAGGGEACTSRWAAANI